MVITNADYPCLKVSELVGLGTVEQYLPHRVAMQFGLDQDLPCSVARPNQNSNRAWKHYIKKIENVKLYLPCRLFEADVSIKYLGVVEEIGVKSQRCK